MYLNKFDFSYNAIGIKSAAKVYFNTTPDSLNLQQAAVLVGMLKASTRYNPVRKPELMLQRTKYRTFTDGKIRIYYSGCCRFGDEIAY